MKLDCKRVAHGQRGKRERGRKSGTDSQEQNVARNREGGGQKGGGGECGLPTADDMLITH